MKAYHYIILISALAVASAGYARKSYTLEECRLSAVESNIKTVNASNQIDISEQTRKEAFTKYFPSLSVGGMGFAANDELLNIGIPMLGELGFAKNGLAANVTATQPVFAGGRIINSNRLAKTGVEASRLQSDISRNEVILATDEYFWQIVVIKEKIKTIDVVMKMLRSLHDDANTAVNAGVKLRNDLLQVDLEINDLEITRMNLENNLTVAKMLLAQFSGFDEDDFDIVYDIESYLNLPGIAEIDDAQALDLLPEYQLLGKKIDASRIQYKIEQGKYLPSVGIGAAYGYNNIMDKSNSSIVGFVQISIPITDWWGGSHAIKKRKIEIENAQNELDDNAELLKIRMQKTLNDMNNALRRIALTKESIAQASENLRLYENFYNAGTTTITDYLNAQTIYRQSLDKYCEAVADYQLCRNRYLNATGRL